MFSSSLQFTDAEALLGDTATYGRSKVDAPHAAQVTQADIAPAIRAMGAIRAAGYPDVRVVFREGSIIVEANPHDADAKPSYLDRGRHIIM